MQCFESTMPLLPVHPRAGRPFCPEHLCSTLSTYSFTSFKVRNHCPGDSFHYASFVLFCIMRLISSTLMTCLIICPNLYLQPKLLIFVLCMFYNLIFKLYVHRFNLSTWMCLGQVQAWTLYVLKYLPILINIPDAQVRNLRVILDVIHGDQEKALTDHQLGL